MLIRRNLFSSRCPFYYIYHCNRAQSTAWNIIELLILCSALYAAYTIKSSTCIVKTGFDPFSSTSVFVLKELVLQWIYGYTSMSFLDLLLSHKDLGIGMFRFQNRVSIAIDVFQHFSSLMVVAAAVGSLCRSTRSLCCFYYLLRRSMRFPTVNYGSQSFHKLSRNLWPLLEITF